MVLIKKYKQDDKKYLAFGPIRISYQTVFNDERRDMYVGPLHFRYWIDDDEGVAWIRVFGKKLRVRIHGLGKKRRHYEMRDI